MIKKNRPISDITLLNHLDRAKGLNHSKTYDNMTTATCFMEFISLTEREKLIDILSEINLFSLIMDGSTDDSVTESDREVEIESEREIQSIREGESASDDNKDE